MTSSPNSGSGGLIGWFANNHVAANILMLLFLIGGAVSTMTMRTETFPPIDPRLITVTVVYPGATPYEVADAITNRVEEVLIGINGVKRISSVATEGTGIVNVEVEDFANADDVYNDVETQVNAISDFPPEDAQRPIVTKVKIISKVLTLAIHGDTSESIIKYWAEKLEDDLRTLTGVAETSLSGIREYEISIEIPESALRQYDLTLQQVSQAVAGFSVDVPAGTIETRRGDILLRVQEKRYTGEEFENIVIRSLPDGSKLRIKDIGTVVDGFEDTNVISLFNGEQAGLIDVFRGESNDTLSVASEIKDYIKTVQLPQGVNLTLQQDETVVLKDRINLMVRNAVLGFMLVFLILLFFLDLKLAFWTSMAIPISFLGGMMLINLAGFSINMISLFALIVVLGVVVDDAIIVGESIFEEQERVRDAEQNDDIENSDHQTARQGAVIKGVYGVLAPVTVGVTTTIAAFAPLIFSTGTLGQIIQVIPIVVISILIVSLFEAYFILPSHLSNPKRWSKGIMAALRDKFAKRLSYTVEHVVLPAARFCMMWRYATLAVFLGIAIITAGMFNAGIVRFIFFPAIEGDEVTVSVTMPEGTPFEVTKRTLLEIESEVSNMRKELMEGDRDIFQSVFTRIGQSASDGGGPRASSSKGGNQLGQVKIQLVSSDYRSVSSTEIESMLRGRIEDLPGIETLEFQSSLIGEEADIEVELTHPEEEQLNMAAEELKESLKAINGTKEVQDTFEPGKTEYVFELTDQGYAAGLTPTDIGRQLRGAFFGLEAQRIQRGNSELIVYVRYPKDQRESLNTLNDMRIRLDSGIEVPLMTVAKYTEQRGYAQIQTVDGKRIVSVTADVDSAITTPNFVMEDMTSVILPELKNKYPGLDYTFAGESRDQAEDLKSLARNMLIALMLIYVLLGSQLRSYVQPLIIMSAIPFGVIGAVWGHFLLGQDLTFISMFGIVALTGVVVNDSVVLMDYYNQQRADGNSTYESAQAAIKRRFRPIMLTTATTSLGLLPMLLETSLQAQFLIPMVISLATGIIFASVVILILVPNLLMISEDIQKLPAKAKSVFKK